MAFLTSPRRQPERDVWRAIPGSVGARHAGDGAERGRVMARWGWGWRWEAPGRVLEREAVAEVETRIANSCCAPLKFSVGRCPGTCSLGHHISKGLGYEGDFVFIVLKILLYGWIGFL